jgi:hypothetical protein
MKELGFSDIIPQLVVTTVRDYIKKMSRDSEPDPQPPLPRSPPQERESVVSCQGDVANMALVLSLSSSGWQNRREARYSEKVSLGVIIATATGVKANTSTIVKKRTPD